MHPLRLRPADSGLRRVPLMDDFPKQIDGFKFFPHKRIPQESKTQKYKHVKNYLPLFTWHRYR